MKIILPFHLRVIRLLDMLALMSVAKISVYGFAIHELAIRVSRKCSNVLVVFYLIDRAFRDNGLRRLHTCDADASWPVPTRREVMC